MNGDLPNGWAWAELDKVCSKIQDGTHFSPKEQSPSGDFKYITAKNIRVSGLDLSNVTYLSEAIHRTIYKRCNPEKGDVLYIKDGATAGIATINNLDEEFSLLSSVALLKPVRGALDSRFLKWYLNSPIGFKAMTDQVTGSAITRLILKTIRKSPIPLAPFAEQQRIAAKLDELLPKMTTCQQRLEKIPAILKRFRRSVLAAACSGRLTEEWRECKSEDGDMPSSWESRQLDSIFSIRTGGTPSRKVKAYFENGAIPWVKTGEVQNCDIYNADEFITEAAVNESNAKVFPAETLLVAMYGEGKTRGQVGRLKIAAATNQACAALINTGLPPETNQYVFYFLLSQYYQLRAESVGGNQPNLNLGIIKEWQVALPPLEEQREIVGRVEAFFALADRLESRYNVGKRRVDSLTHSILAKAFNGELVPTEAELAEREGRSYESVAQLLKRVQGK